ncbi:hypothetical protein Q4512_10030 [Oceanihabitans sp. 2_MG-2023]|uniref:hypothetical protein n=1 Tax=Oceanihabitans sp. 2_MG-2023 TaxID=3062661 RepID=UPI0026E2C6CA|nr:hypothetical protein [Oceanihabitans sp. 2_MG-2023]MDO6597251.1 hypothetical protein [Oceanihabitans sp. 2_MG-2023]
MIYLGDQIDALNAYSKEAVCWLGVKLKGRLTTSNSHGYSCGDSACYPCNHSNIRSKINQGFRDLFTDATIKELIEAKPHRLIEINNSLQTKFIAATGRTVKDFKANAKKLCLISGFTGWFSKDETVGEKWNYRLARLLDKHTCTYCNREYVFVYRNPSGSGKGMVPQFDHWFAKTDYPLLAISFYNLIPSCATCNTIKSSTDLNLTDHLHPYVDSNISSTYEFSYLPITNIDNRIILKNSSLFNSKGLDTVNALNLPLIYKGHSGKELQDLIDLRYKYSDNYLNILLEDTFGDLQISKEERYRLIFGIELDEENHHKRIFSKFKGDIISELLSIK